MSLKIIYKTFIYNALSFLLIASCNPSSTDRVYGFDAIIWSKACKPDSSQNRLLLDLVARDDNDSVFLSTFVLNKKLEVNLKDLKKSNGFAKLLSSLCTNDSVTAYLNCDTFYSAFASEKPPYLTKSVHMKINLRVKDKLDDAQYHFYKLNYEKSQIENYVNKSARRLMFDSSGIWYEIEKGSGEDFSTANMVYDIKTVSGKTLASSHPDYPMPYKVGETKLFEGLQFLISKMKKGDKARAVIPSALAYGNKGNDNVPAYTPIVLELELKIKKSAVKGF